MKSTTKGAIAGVVAGGVVGYFATTSSQRMQNACYTAHAPTVGQGWTKEIGAAVNQRCYAEYPVSSYLSGFRIHTPMEPIIAAFGILGALAGAVAAKAASR